MAVITAIGRERVSGDADAGLDEVELQVGVALAVRCPVVLPSVVDGVAAVVVVVA